MRPGVRLAAWGARAYPPASRVQRELGALRGVQGSLGEPLSIQGAQILSGYVHLAVLAALALLSPRLPHGDEPDAESIEDRIALMRSMLEASAGATGTPLPAMGSSVDVEAEADATSDIERAGSEAKDPIVAERAGGRPGLLRRASASPSIAESSRDAALRESATFGMVGALANHGLPGAGTTRWSASHAEGMPGAGDLGDWGGLGLSGIGEGGSDGWGNGILLGSIGTLGHDTGTAEGIGATGGWGRLAGHRAVGPVVCGCEGTQVSGRLPPEAVQRVVRQNMGRFRYCYERAPRPRGRLLHRQGLRGPLVPGARRGYRLGGLPAVPEPLRIGAAHCKGSSRGPSNVWSRSARRDSG